MRLTFNQVAEQAANEGLELIRLTRGYKLGTDSAASFKNLESVVEFLESVRGANLVKEESEEVIAGVQVLETVEETVEPIEQPFNQVEDSTVTQTSTSNNYWQTWQNNYQTAINKLTVKSEPSQVPAFDNPVWIGLIIFSFLDILFSELKLIYLQIEKKLNTPQTFAEMYKAAKIVSGSQAFKQLQKLV